MDMINWIGKNFEEIKETNLYNNYFNAISLEKNIDTLYLFNPQKGIDIVLHQNNYIKAIHFYSGKQDGSNMFPDKLPFDLDFSFSRNDARLILGVPSLSGGGDFSFLYGTTPPWDKYFFESFKLHLQYSSDEKNIELLTIDS